MKTSILLIVLAIVLVGCTQSKGTGQEMPTAEEIEQGMTELEADAVSESEGSQEDAEAGAQQGEGETVVELPEGLVTIVIPEPGVIGGGGEEEGGGGGFVFTPVIVQPYTGVHSVDFETTDGQPMDCEQGMASPNGKLIIALCERPFMTKGGTTNIYTIEMYDRIADRFFTLTDLSSLDSAKIGILGDKSWNRGISICNPTTVSGETIISFIDRVSDAWQQNIIVKKYNKNNQQLSSYGSLLANGPLDTAVVEGGAGYCSRLVFRGKPSVLTPETHVLAAEMSNGGFQSVREVSVINGQSVGASGGYLISHPAGGAFMSVSSFGDRLLLPILNLDDNVQRYYLINMETGQSSSLDIEPESLARISPFGNEISINDLVGASKRNGRYSDFDFGGIPLDSWNIFRVAVPNNMSIISDGVVPQYNNEISCRKSAMSLLGDLFVYVCGGGQGQVVVWDSYTDNLTDLGAGAYAGAPGTKGSPTVSYGGLTVVWDNNGSVFWSEINRAQ